MAGRNLFNNGPLQGRFIEKAKNYKPGFVASFQDADTIKSCGFAFPSAAGSSGDALKLLSVADGTTEWGSAGGGGGQTVEAALTSADAGSTLAPGGTDVIYPVSIDADYTINLPAAASGQKIKLQLTSASPRPTTGDIIQVKTFQNPATLAGGAPSGTQQELGWFTVSTNKNSLTWAGYKAFWNQCQIADGRTQKNSGDRPNLPLLDPYTKDTLNLVCGCSLCDDYLILTSFSGNYATKDVSAFLFKKDGAKWSLIKELGSDIIWNPNYYDNQPVVGVTKLSTGEYMAIIYSYYPHTSTVWCYAQNEGGADNWGLRQTITGYAILKVGNNNTLSCRGDYISLARSYNIYIWKYDTGTAQYVLEQNTTGLDYSSTNSLPIGGACTSSISEDGEWCAVGFPSASHGGTNSGRVWIFKYDSATSSWLQTQTIDGGGTNYYAGQVSIDPQGTVMAIGAPGVWGTGSFTQVGEVFFYRLVAGTWTFQNSHKPTIEVNSAWMGGSWLGTRVQVGDNFVIASGPKTAANQGIIEVYSKPSNKLTISASGGAKFNGGVDFVTSGGTVDVEDKSNVVWHNQNTIGESIEFHCLDGTNWISKGAIDLVSF